MMTPSLNRRVTLETKIRVPDGAGGFSEDWKKLGQMWAWIEAGKGREKSGIEVTFTSTPYKIVIRAAPEGNSRRPIPGQRFVYGSRFFLILSVAEYGSDGRYLCCSSEEEVAL